MNVFSSTLLITVALTTCVSIVSAQNKSGGISLRQVTGSTPTETLMRNTPHSKSGTPELTRLVGVLKDIYVEDWGELVLLDAGNIALYNDASIRSGIMETKRRNLTIEGPVVLPCFGRQNGWFAVEHPTENTVGWVSGNYVRRAGQTPIAESQQNRMYQFGEWEMLCVAVNQETRLALGYIQRKRKAAINGKPLRQIAMGKVLNDAFVFHYFVNVDIIRRDRKNNSGFTAVWQPKSQMFDIRVGTDLLIPKYSHLNMIDLQRLPSSVIEQLFGDIIKDAEPLDAHSYLFVTSELLSEENEDRSIHWW